MAGAVETVKLDAIAASKAMAVRVRVVRVRELRIRYAIGHWLVRLGQRVGAFRFEFVDTLPLPRHDRRREARRR